MSRSGKGKTVFQMRQSQTGPIISAQSSNSRPSSSAKSTRRSLPKLDIPDKSKPNNRNSHVGSSMGGSMQGSSNAPILVMPQGQNANNENGREFLNILREANSSGNNEPVVKLVAQGPQYVCPQPQFVSQPTIMQPVNNMPQILTPVNDGSNGMDNQSQPITLVTPTGQRVTQYQQPQPQKYVLANGQLMVAQPQQPTQKMIQMKNEDGEYQTFIVQEPPQQQQTFIPVQTVQNSQPQFMPNGSGQYVMVQQPQRQSQHQFMQVQPNPVEVQPQFKQGTTITVSTAPMMNNKRKHVLQQPIRKPAVISASPIRNNHGALNTLSEVAAQEHTRELNKGHKKSKMSQPSPDQHGGMEFRERERLKASMKSSPRKDTFVSVSQQGPMISQHNTLVSPQSTQSQVNSSTVPSNTFVLSATSPRPGTQMKPTANVKQEYLLHNEPGESSDGAHRFDSKIPMMKSSTEKNVDKRERNKMAARRCRQRKMDKIKALEDTVTRMNDVLSTLRHTLTSVKRFANDHSEAELQNIVSAIDLNDKYMQPFDLRRLDEELMSEHTYSMPPMTESFETPERQALQAARIHNEATSYQSTSLPPSRPTMNTSSGSSTVSNRLPQMSGIDDARAFEDIPTLVNDARDAVDPSGTHNMAVLESQLTKLSNNSSRVPNAELIDDTASGNGNDQEPRSQNINDIAKEITKATQRTSSTASDSIKLN